MKYSIQRLLIDLKTAQVLYQHQPEASKVLDKFIEDALKAACFFCAKGMIAWREAERGIFPNYVHTTEIDEYTKRVTCQATGLRELLCEEV